MRKVYLVAVGSIVCALIVILVAVQGFFLRDWRTIATFSGDEGLDIRTSPFFIPSSTWRIYYNMTRKGLKDFAHLSVSIYIRDASESDPESYSGGFSYAAQYLQTGESWGDVYEIDPRYNPVGSREFYLKISAKDCNWTITIEAWS